MPTSSETVASVAQAFSALHLFQRPCLGLSEDQAPEPDNGYSLKTVGFGTIDGVMLVALIRLLANTSAPAYHVVVGEVAGAERVQRVMQKLGGMTVALRPAWGPTAMR